MSDTWGLCEVGIALCDCIQSSDPNRAIEGARRLQQIQGRSAFAIAAENDVQSHVAHALQDEADEDWKAAHEFVKSKMLTYMSELDDVATILATADIPVVALKNAGIARGIYSCLGCCPMGDLDLMVRRSDFRKAHELLITNGYQFEFRSELEEEDLDEAEKGGGSEYFKILPNGEKLWLELQWRPVAGRWIQPKQEPDSTDLMSRSQEIPGTKVRLLAPEDNLLQVALHTAKHTYVRAPGLRLHTDVDRIVMGQSIDWDAFTARVKTLRLKTAVYFSLLIARDVLHTQIPSRVLRELYPGKLRAWLLSSWIRRAGLIDPKGQKFGRVKYLIFNSLLYDDLVGLYAGIFPSPEWMMERYDVDSTFWLPVLYVRRAFALCFRRTNT